MSRRAGVVATAVSSRGRGAVSALALLALGGCARTLDPARQGVWWGVAERTTAVERAPGRTSAVVLVTLDGARWQEIFDGVDPALAAQQGLAPSEVVPADRLLPNVYARLITRGVALGAPGHGAEITASGPRFVSLPGYIELFSGHAADGCRSNDCARVTRATLLDALGDAGVARSQLAVVSSWETIERAAAARPDAVTLSAGRTHGATRDGLRAAPGGEAWLALGEGADAAPGGGDYRPDRYTAPLALRYLAHARPTVLFVGLGDPDEYAHAGDYAGYLAALRAADAFVGELFRTLDALGDYGRSVTVVLTADHGRAYDFASHGDAPESGRTWLLMAGGAVPSRGFVRAPTRRYLRDVAPTLRALLGLAPDRSAGAGVVMPELLAEGGERAAPAAATSGAGAE